MFHALVLHNEGVDNFVEMLLDILFAKCRQMTAVINPVDNVDKPPCCFQHIINRQSVDKPCRHPPFPHFHRAYYYYGYLFIYLVSNIKKKERV